MALVDYLRSHTKGRLLEHEPLSRWTAYGIGGPADALFEPANEDELCVALEAATKYNVPITSLGNGTNLLVRDGGVRGLVVYLAQRGRRDGLDEGIDVIEETDTSALVRVSSRCAKARLLDFALDRGFAGLEFSAGIPGSLGGAVFMNAGTKWGSYGDVIERVHFFKPGDGRFTKTSAEIGFKYRGHGEGLLSGGTVVLAVEVRLSKTKPKAEIRALVDEILGYRGGKQPLELPNCGSVFKNPANSALGAGRLIEACGLKGKTVGGAQVSLKHANFILNLGGATSNDVETLIREVQAVVFAQRGVALETEVIVLGES